MADEPQGADKLDGLQKLLAKKDGDAMAVAALLYSDNFDLREKNRQLKEKLPAEGSVMLSKEEALMWEAMKGLNLKPEEIKAKVESVLKLEEERDALKRDKVLRSVADAGYSFDALKDFDSLEGGLEYVVSEKDGKKSVSVKAEGKEISLDDYAKEKRPAIAQILKSEPQGGTRMPNQNPGGKPPANNVFDKIRSEEEAKNKQRKPAATLDDRFPRAAA